MPLGQYHFHEFQTLFIRHYLLNINSEKYMFILMLQDTVIYGELIYKYLSIEVNDYIERERKREREREHSSR